MKYGYSASTLLTSDTAASRREPETVPGPSTEATRRSCDTTTSSAAIFLRLVSRYGARGLRALSTRTIGSAPNVEEKLAYACASLELLPTSSDWPASTSKRSKPTAPSAPMISAPKATRSGRREKRSARRELSSGHLITGG